MIFKRVAVPKWVRRARRVRRWRRVLHPLLVARITIWALMLPRTVAAGDAAAVSPPLVARLDAATAQSTDALLTNVYRTQNVSGLYAPDDDGAVLMTRPLFATMALDVYATTHNVASLALSANSIARYYSYLFSSCDRDGNRLIETPATIQGRSVRIEDPAYNALLAVDARNLARINLELRRTMQALYWYDGARSVERAVVAGTFDPEDDYFFPRDPASGQPVRTYSPAAALPADFPLAVGANHAVRVVAHVVDWAAQAGSNVDPAERAANAIDYLCAVQVLSGGAHAPVIDALRQKMPLPSSTGVPAEAYALARARVEVPLTEDDVAFGLLLNLERGASFSDAERFRIERALPNVRALAFAPNPPVLSIDDANASVRTVYTTVAAIRDQLKASAFFNPDDRKAYPGVDPTIAVQRLLDDVVLLVHRAENRVFEMRYAAQGVHAQVALVSDRVVVGDDITAHWEVTSTNAPAAWKNLSVGVFGEAIAPVNGVSLAVAPAAPLRFATRYVARGTTGVLRLVTLAAVFEDADGSPARVYFDRSVYLNPPVMVTARFPQGRTMQASNVPVELVLKQYARVSTGAKYFWFSPAGLRVIEGNTGLIHFGPGDSTLVTLHVEIPAPCRPGVFPFTLKFFAGDRDAGVINSSLFKPYEWTFVGPFPPDGGLDRALPPEQGVNLLQSYAGPNGAARWRAVPEAACDPRGGIALRTLANDRGIHYLYTIVACAYETNLKARLCSNVPAVLFVNGRRVAAITAAGADSAVANVQLDPDKNHILIKVLGDRDARVSFALGNDDNLAADEFDNNLAELAGGYREMTERDLATAPAESRRLVTLRFQDAEAGSVAVVGSFNGWSPAMNPMQKNGDTWELTLSLLPGKYSYRFLVDQKKQVLDPASKNTEPDGYGGRNSVLVVNQ